MLPLPVQVACYQPKVHQSELVKIHIGDVFVCPRLLHLWVLPPVYKWYK